MIDRGADGRWRDAGPGQLLPERRDGFDRRASAGSTWIREWNRRMEDMSENDLIQRLSAALAGQLQPPVPVDIDLWDVATIARVMKRSESQVRNRMTCLPDFPKAIRLPVAGGGRGQPLYRASEILEWAGKYQDRH